ncbi:MAG: T9SS type A sorting domain-containing protein [Candidatus Methanospirare jalkutatii]|nr:T9SS type A sorting domain-containing protein [Candidatus Methanospirare jalkutatii]
MEISVNGGAWTQIEPEGGYPYRIRTGGEPGPFPAETPCYSGTSDWSEAVFDLSEYEGSARIRFRFGSDGAVTREGWYIDDVIIIGDGPGAQDKPLVLKPVATLLYQNSPNPFGAGVGATRIAFDLAEPARISLEVFDVNGRLIRTLLDRTLQPGRYDVAWDGSDNAGNVVGSGVYFYRLETSKAKFSKRMLVVK